VDLTGKFNTGSWAHDLLVGVEYSHEERLPRLFSTANSDSYIDPFNPGAGGWAPRPAQGTPSQHNHHIAKARALYAQDLISLSPHWKLLLGARHDSFDFGSTNLLTNAGRSYSGNSVSPRAGLVWQPVQEHSLYASFSKSFSPYGGRGQLSVDVSPTAVYDDEPQYSRQYEAGIKSDWLRGGLSTQLSVYQLEHHNIRYRPDPVNEPFEWQVRGKERSRGVEFSAAGRLAAAWYLRGGVGAQNATVVQDLSAPANEGKYLPNVARRNGNAFLRFAPSGPWYAEVGVTHSSARWLNAANTQRLPGYTRWDALVGWRTAPWTVTAAVSNLFDKEYWRASSMPGAPRSLLINSTYHF
jgi:iron complex outermembrane receptor protein